jgi:hypothetical protein
MTFRKSVLFATALVFAQSVHAFAQSDAYANEEKQAALQTYLAQRAEYLEEVRYMYFAVGCGVFASEAGISPYLFDLGNALDQTAQAGSSTIIDTKLQGMMHAAAADGMTRAAKKGECAYWKQHPQEVYRVRSEAIAAFPQ